jgi:putative PIN family toxin of toxin-antitoxin system
MPARHRPKVFLDSNVIFSGLHSTAGPPAEILRLLAAGRVHVVISEMVLEEVIRTIGQKLPAALSSLRTLLVNAPLTVVRDPTAEEVGSWQNRIPREDAAILVSAITAEPDYFITGDRHFRTIRGSNEVAGLRIVTPMEFIRELQQDR